MKRWGDALAALFVLWLVVPSGALLRVQEVRYNYETETISVLRVVPWTLDVSARFEVVDAANVTCNRDFRTPFERLPGNIATAPAPWVKPCRDKHPVTLRASFQVHLFGLIPMRPVRFETILPPAG